MITVPVFFPSPVALRLRLCARRGVAVELLYPIVKELGKDRVRGTKCGGVWEGG